MQLDEIKTIEEIKDEVEGAQSFQIKATPVIFKLMSKDIYRDKILAVVRELSTNAVDSMKEAGTLKSKQFAMYIPNPGHYTFYVRDYGTGLDDEGVKSIYTYGDSSRNTSNKFTGAFGIGAKAPFAYSKEFYVDAFKDKVRRYYKAELIEGVPTIRKISEEPTDEPNGVKVSLPVQPNDCDKFQQAVMKFFRIYNHIPACNMNIEALKVPFAPKLSYPNNENPLYALEGDGGGTIYVVMGGIPYTVMSTYSYFNEIEHNYDHRGLIYNSNADFYIFAPMGKYPILPSREEIDVNSDNTKRMLEDDYNTAEMYFQCKLKSRYYELKATEGMNKAIALLDSIYRARTSYRSLCKEDFSGFGLEEAEKIVSISNIFKEKSKHNVWAKNADEANIEIFPTSSGMFNTGRRYYYRNRSEDLNLGDTRFLLRDYKSAVDKLPANFVTHNMSNELLAMKDYLSYVKNIAIDRLGYNEERIVLLSEIVPKPAPIKRTSVRRKPSEHVEGYLIHESSDCRSVTWDQNLSPVTFTDDVFYVTIEDMKYYGSMVARMMRMLSIIRRQFIPKKNETPFKIYGISVNYHRKLEKEDGMVKNHHLESYLNECIASMEFPIIEEKYDVLLFGTGKPADTSKCTKMERDIIKHVDEYHLSNWTKLLREEACNFSKIHIPVKVKTIDLSDLDYILETINFTSDTARFIDRLDRKDYRFKAIEMLAYLKSVGKLEDFFPKPKPAPVKKPQQPDLPL